ncbi:MAG TPA: S8 family serine peptidase [Acidimicrobiales bacterium]|nr:S8 family serine peptidase [Acidimicrobiales bacterium]
MKTRSTLVALATVAGLGWPLALPAQAAPPERREPGRPTGYIVVLKESAPDVDAVADRHERARGFRAPLRYRTAVRGYAARLSPAQADELSRDPEVAFVSPDRPVYASRVAGLAPGDSAPMGVRRLEAASSVAAHNASGVNVAVLDSGIDLDHPDLNVAAGPNCVGAGPADDDNGHGTHVAGSIAARNDGAGVVGVAPNTRLYAVKVMNAAGEGTWSSIICGIDWVTSTRTDADPANNVAVANLSLGGPGDPVRDCATTTDAMHRAICASTGAGVTYVVAAGNNGWDFDYANAPDLPAAYPQVLTVTAASDSDGRPGSTGPVPVCRTGEVDDRFATFSNFALTAAGASHTIAAPGTCIASTWPGGGYATISGTSMAAPHVAGAVALCLNEAGVAGACSGLAPGQIVQKLRADAAHHAGKEPCDGFAGDPQHTRGGAYFGYLNWVSVAGTEAAGVARCDAVAFATTGSVYGGTGQLSRLGDNDTSYLEVSSTYTQGAYVAELRPSTRISADQRSSLKKLIVTVDGNVTSRGASLSLRILNMSTGAWETIDGPVGGVVTDRTVSWSTVSPLAYVSGSGEIRVAVTGRSTSSFRARTDLVRFTIEN